MTQHLDTICIQKHTFLIFVKPWFWTTLLVFCLILRLRGSEPWCKSDQKASPGKKWQKFEDKTAQDQLLDEKLGNWPPKWSPKVSQNLYKSNPGPSWDPKMAHAPPESCPSRKKRILDMKMMSQMLQNYHPRPHKLFCGCQKRELCGSRKGAWWFDSSTSMAHL